MELLRDFKNISKSDVYLAGGKGASLGEMTQAGISVPNGFVILSNAFEKFLEATDLNVEIDSILDSVNHKEIYTIEKASEKIQALILGAEMPQDIKKEIQKFFKTLNSKYVAVRSSATAEDSESAAWAGQLESYLNTTEENLLGNVQQCWASLFTPRAIFYRFEKNLHKQKISVAVVVQKMVESEKSGIAFSVHPVTQDNNQLIIEAGFGLGEAIVSGQVTPDSYVVGKEPRNILDININTQTKGLFRSKKGGNEWVVIHEPKASSQVLSKKQILRLSELILKIENHYDFPCDIEWAFEKERFYIVQSRPITTLTTKSDKNPIKKKVIFGNQDIDASIVALEMTWKGMRDKRIKKQVGTVLPEIYNELVNGKTINGYVNPEDFKHFVKVCCEKLLEDKKFIKKIRKATEKICANMINYAKENLSLIDSIEIKRIPKILNEIRKMQSECSFWGMAVAFADVFGTITNQSLEIISNRSRLKYSVHTYSKILSASDKKSFTQIATEKIKNAKKGNNLLKKYFWLNQGYVGRGLLSEELKEIKNTKINSENYEMTKEEARKELKLNEAEIFHFNLLADMAYIKSLRADYRQCLNVLLNLIIDRLAKAWKIEGKYLETLTAKEICKIIQGKKQLLENLKLRFEHSLFVYKNGEDYEIFSGQNVHRLLDERIIKPESKDAGKIKGNVAYPGKVKGRVKLIFGPQHNYKVKEGDVLVSTATSPQLLPAMRKAVAFVTDIGGITSHAAIVARELKKPCIVGTKVATQLLKDGDMVEVDANSGVVKVFK